MKKTELKRAGTPLTYESPEARVFGVFANAVLCASKETEDYKEGTDYGEEDLW